MALIVQANGILSFVLLGKLRCSKNSFRAMDLFDEAVYGVVLFGLLRLTDELGVGGSLFQTLLDRREDG